jgi:putative ABC transport system permease protein
VLFLNIRLAWSSLLRNRLRTALCVIAIGIGIGAVICTASLGEAGAARVQAQMDALGEDFLWIRAGSQNIGGVRTGSGGVRTLTAEDAASLPLAIADIRECSPVMSGREQILTAGRNWNTRYQGVTPAFFRVRRRSVQAGVLFSDQDAADRARVVVLGPAVAERLFGTDNPVGQNVRLNRFPFKVLGVLAPRGSDRGGVDRDDVIFVPLTTAIRTLDRRTWVTDIMCGVLSPDHMPAAEQQAAALLRVRHGIEPDEPDDFQIERPLDSLAMRAATADTMAILLVSIGTVSLVVGGVGIMNIMLVSVAERRREIGVRLAIGARVRDIRGQFLLEAVLLGVLGGAVGILVGWSGAWLLSAGFDWPAVITMGSTATAALTAIGAALLFGYYPAHRASNLDPMAAIHSEP